MSDTEQSQAPTPETSDTLTDREVARVEAALKLSEEQASGSTNVAPAAPPPASDAQEGVDPAPPGDSSPSEGSALVETPVQGAALIAGEPIPPADAQPVVLVVDAANVVDEASAPG